MATQCAYLNGIRFTHTDKNPRGEWIKTGDRWIHLRMCLECGHVGCCNSSKNKNATKHFRHNRHPLVRSIESGEDWVWCYIDEVAPGELHSAHFVSIHG